jgi:hypothetical protein
LFCPSGSFGKLRQIDGSLATLEINPTPEDLDGVLAERMRISL